MKLIFLNITIKMAQPVNLLQLIQNDLGSVLDLSTQNTNNASDKLDGKLTSFDVKLLEKRINDEDADVNTFEDWTLYRYKYTDGRPLAVFAFNVQEPNNSSRLSKRVYQFNNVIERFTVNNPNITLLKAPLPVNP